MQPRGRRVVVVGSCAAGKSTLVGALRDQGFDAFACAQEHSDIPTLWKHLEPDAMVYLDVDLATIRSRRSPVWPEAIFLRQQHRLRDARKHADVIVDTRSMTIAESVVAVIKAIKPKETGAVRGDSASNPSVD